MGKPTVHYLSLRNIPEFEKEKRRNPPSGQKQDYIIESLVSLGYKVNYVSFSESFNNKFYRAKKKKLSENVTFFLTPNIPGKYRESFSFRWFYHIYALNHIKKGDILLVYHTNSMRNDILRRLADKKKLTFIYEVEELYEYAHEIVDEKLVEKEINFLQCPDKYLFCSELLQNRVNLKNLPYVVVEGFYKYIRPNVEKFNDGKIHCIYGGIIDEVKGGAFRSVKAAEYLPDNYVIHILGFGDKAKLQSIIKERESFRQCKVVYEGLKQGQDYIDFISKCDIGLSLMTMREDINNTAFPSKLILYMACGLNVVACRVKVLEISKTSKAITFYDEDSAEAIAEAIMKIKTDKSANLKTIMDTIDLSFKNNLNKLLGN